MQQNMSEMWYFAAFLPLTEDFGQNKSLEGLWELVINAKNLW